MDGAGKLVNIRLMRAPTERNMKEIRAHIAKYQTEIHYLKGAIARYEVSWAELERRDGDQVLQAITPLLLEIHKRYYDKNIKGPKDVRTILAQIAGEIFSGLTFLFTGVFRDNDPRKEHVVKSAIWFGAKIAETITPGNKEKVTHVICSRGRTTKVRIAQNEPGVKIVHVNWMYNSMIHFIRSDEELYQMIPKNEQRLPMQKQQPVMSEDSKANAPEVMNVDTASLETSQDEKSVEKMNLDQVPD